MLTIAVLKESKPGERRVAATPETVRKYVALGAAVSVEKGAGEGAAISDGDYRAAGATVAENPAAAADIVLAVRPPVQVSLETMREGALLVGMLEPYGGREALPLYQRKKISAFALELLPRISRAQAMDVLSSQSSLAGYRAVIEAASASAKVIPMMMTAAGTVSPVRALVLGAGVAGLQAIATAKRLGAMVCAFDVRAAAREQVESLGAKFIEVKAEESGESTGGYAREMSEDYKKKQAALIHETIKKQDMVISTALIPGKPAPVLITEEMVKDMKPGAVIVDMAALAGGNCALTEPDKAVVKYGVTLLGITDLPSRAAVDASALYARNLFNFVSTLLVEKGGLAVKWEDELVAKTLLARDGQALASQG